MHGIPLVIFIRVNGRTAEFVMIDDDSRVAVERQTLGIRRTLIGWQVEARVAGRQDGRDSLPRHGQHLAVRRPADGLMTRQQHEVGAFGQRNQVVGRQAHVLASRAAHTFEACRIEDVAILVRIDGRDEIIHVPAPPASSFSAFSD